ncbi:UNVERIFIED_CONTAM: hypothetical protein GTU68_015438 [Idotea baltica]|nr:hypothetical protein [Idotea baltica]
MNILHVILSIFLPPLAVYLDGQDSKNIVINIILCFLGFLPAILHALFFTVFKKMK